MAQQKKASLEHNFDKQDIKKMKMQQARRLFDSKLISIREFISALFLMYYQYPHNIIDSSNIDHTTLLIHQLKKIEDICKIERTQTEDRHPNIYKGLYINNTNNCIYVGIIRKNYIYLFQIGTRLEGIGGNGIYRIRIHLTYPISIRICETEDESFYSKYSRISQNTFDIQRQSR